VSKRVSPTERIRADIDALFASERDLAATLEDVARLSVRLMMQTGIEAEVDEFLGRGRYERRGDDDRPGSRNGHQHRRIPVEERPGGRLMAQQSTNTLLDQATADRLSVAVHHCFSDYAAADDLFADDVFYDLLPPMWRFQLEGPRRDVHQPAAGDR
jgi:Transposase, Mutator family